MCVCARVSVRARACVRVRACACVRACEYKILAEGVFATQLSSNAGTSG